MFNTSRYYLTTLVELSNHSKRRNTKYLFHASSSKILKTERSRNWRILYRKLTFKTQIMLVNISKHLLFIFIFSLLISCTSETKNTALKIGFWRGEITIQNQQLPFVFEIVKNKNTYKINLHDSDNIIELDEVTV